MILSCHFLLHFWVNPWNPTPFFWMPSGTRFGFFSHVLLEHADWEEQQSYYSLFWPQLTEVPNLFSCLTDVFVLVGTDY